MKDGEKFGVSTRDRLIATAKELASERGFDRSSLSDLLERSAISKGAFYHHFSSKDSLVLAVLHADREEFMSMLDSCLSGDGGALFRIDSFFSAALAKHRDRRFAGGCLWGNTALEMSDTNAELTACVLEVFEAWIAKLGAVIGEGQEAGEIRDDLPAKELARLIVAGLEGGIMLSRLSKGEGPMRSCIMTLRGMLTGKERDRR